MQIVVGERSFQANAILAAYLGASPDLAEVCATATKSPLQVWDKFDVQGATVQVMRTRSMTEIRIGVEPDLDLIFAFKPVEEAVMHLVYLGRDGHRANALATEAGLHAPLGRLVPTLPGLLGPFALLKSARHIHLRGGHYLSVAFEDLDAA